MNPTLPLLLSYLDHPNRRRHFFKDNLHRCPFRSVLISAVVSAASSGVDGSGTGRPMKWMSWTSYTTRRSRIFFGLSNRVSMLVVGAIDCFPHPFRLLRNDSTILQWMLKLISESNANEISQVPPSLFRHSPHKTCHFFPAIVTPRFNWKLFVGSIKIDGATRLELPNLEQKLIRNNLQLNLTVSNWTRRLRQFCWKMEKWLKIMNSNSAGRLGSYFHWMRTNLENAECIVAIDHLGFDQKGFLIEFCHRQMKFFNFNFRNRIDAVKLMRLTFLTRLNNLDKSAAEFIPIISWSFNCFPVSDKLTISTFVTEADACCN